MGGQQSKKEKKKDLEYKIPTFFFCFWPDVGRGSGTWIVIGGGGGGGGGGAEDDTGALCL